MFTVKAVTEVGVVRQVNMVGAVTVEIERVDGNACVTANKPCGNSVKFMVGTEDPPAIGCVSAVFIENSAGKTTEVVR